MSDYENINDKINKNKRKINKNIILWFILILLAIYIGPRYVVNNCNIEEQVETEKKEINDKINPNKASWASLARLPGIGETLAKEIVNFRQEYWLKNEKQKCFKKCEDLVKVKGIGPIKSEQVRPYLVF